MSIQAISKNLLVSLEPPRNTRAIKILSFLSLFMESVWGVSETPPTNGVCTLGQTAVFFTPDCPSGWEPIDRFGTRHIKITNNSSLVGSFGGVEIPILSEENIPMHIHKISGSPSESSGNVLGYGPYAAVGQESYRLEGTTHTADTFDSGAYGKENPSKIPEHAFVYARLCNCTSNGEKTIKSLLDRVDKLENSRGSIAAVGITGLITGLIGAIFALGTGINWVIQTRRRVDEIIPLINN